MLVKVESIKDDSIARQLCARSSPRTVFVASDVQLVSEGLQLLLGRFEQIRLIGGGTINDDCIARIASESADAVVLDFGSAAAAGFAQRLICQSPQTRIVGIAIGSTSLEMADWAELGVAGFVDDDGSIEEVAAAIMRVTRGEFFSSPRTAAALVTALVGRVANKRAPEGARRLTPRELEILHDLERGATNKEIARRLGISAATVKNHIHHVLEKLEVRRRHEAGAFFRTGRI